NSFNTSSLNSELLIANTFLSFVKEQKKNLPQKKIDEMLLKAQNIGKEMDDYSSIQIILQSAEIYLQINDQIKAIGLMNKALSEAKESSDANNLLIEVGRFFEQNKLKADAKTKKILREYIDTVSR